MGQQSKQKIKTFRLKHFYLPGRSSELPEVL